MYGVSGSMGINIPQVLVAGVENMVVSKSGMKNTAAVAISVGISNLVPAYAPGASGAFKWGSGTEKYIIEPVIAGLLYSLGTRYFGGDGEGSFIKKFGKGFLIGSSSAGVAASLLSATVAPATVQSQYSGSGTGLRNVATQTKLGNATNFVVS